MKETTLLDLDEKSFAHLISCLTLRDNASLAATSTEMHYIIWKIFWIILPKLLRKYQFENNPGLLREFLEFNSSFAEQLSYHDKMRILSCTRHKLTSIIHNDITSTWKIAAICGKESLVENTSAEVMQYYALGGQITCLQNFIVKYHTPYDWQKIDPEIKLPRMAVIGGHVKLLAYLQTELHYDFNVIFNKNEDLLTLATEIGQPDCIEFLIQFGLSQEGLLYFAIRGGSWKLSERFSQTSNSVEYAYYFAKQACLHGNLSLAITLISNLEYNNIEVSKLWESVVAGGHAEVFWHFINQGWLSLSQKDYQGATILHLLAYAGHLHLICAIMREPRENISLFDLDKHGKSVLHYAAKGNHWYVFKHLRKMDAENKLAWVDYKGFTVAHEAARLGAACFLLRLELHFPNLLYEKSSNNSTILHSAGKSCETHVSKMIIEKFGIDPKLQNNKGETFIHKTAKQGEKFSHFWSVLKSNLTIFGKQYLDIPNAAGKTVRQMIQENNVTNQFEDLLEI